MIEKISRTAVRQRKHLRVREKISGTAEKPRFHEARRWRQLRRRCQSWR